MSEWLGGGSRQPDGRIGSDEADVEPKGQSVDSPGLQHVEFQGDFNPVQFSLMSGLEVDAVPYRLCHANTSVKGVDLEIIVMMIYFCACKRILSHLRWVV